MADQNLGAGEPAKQNLGAGEPAKRKTVKYKVTCTCYWNEILWREDEEVELASNLTPPKDYFEKI